MFRSNLRQKKPALCVQHYQEPMKSNLDGFRNDRGQRRQQGDLEAEFVELVLSQRGKARIFQRRACGTANDGFPERFSGLDYADSTL